MNRWNRNAQKQRKTAVRNVRQIIRGLESNYWNSAWTLGVEDEMLLKRNSLPLTHSGGAILRALLIQFYVENIAQYCKRFDFSISPLHAFVFVNFLSPEKKLAAWTLPKIVDFSRLRLVFVHGACCCRVIRWQRNGKQRQQQKLESGGNFGSNIFITYFSIYWD